MDYGFVKNESDTEAFIKTLPDYHYELKSFYAQDDGSDTFLYRALVTCLKKKFPNWVDGERLKSYNQGVVGSCVGVSESQLLNITEAIDCVIKRHPESFEYMSSAEGTYGLVREACNMKRGDGAYGAGAAKAVSNLGTLWMKSYGNINLDVEYSASRCREYGSSWVGEELKKAAVEHKVKSANQVKNAEEAWALIGGAYAIQVCSNRGFANQRDEDGFCRASGVWNHAMAIVGRRTTKTGRKGFLILNSWGDNWCSGPLFEDQPKGSFYADYDVVDSMIKQGDTYNLCDFSGFTPKKLLWDEI